jgi:hypothetical protein
MFHHFRVTLNTNLLHIHIYNAFLVMVLNGTAHQHTLDEDYKFKIWGRETILFLVFMPTAASQYETTSAMFLLGSQGPISSLPAVKK